MDSVDMDKYRGWLTKQQAADRLGRSLKTVQRLAATNRISSVALRDPHAPGGEVWLYDPSDVDRIAAPGHRALRPAVVTADHSPNGNGHDVNQAIATMPTGGALVELPAAQAAASAAIVTLVSRLSIQWLTLKGAAAETNRSQASLLRKIKDGTLYAERDRGWRIADGTWSSYGQAVPDRERPRAAIPSRRPGGAL